MPLRMLSYTSLLLLKLVETRKVFPHHPLPAVLPIVLYNGGTARKVPLDVASLFGPMPQDWSSIVPNTAIFCWARRLFHHRLFRSAARDWQEY